MKADNFAIFGIKSISYIKFGQDTGIREDQNLNEVVISCPNFFMETEKINEQLNIDPIKELGRLGS